MPSNCVCVCVFGSSNTREFVEIVKKKKNPPPSAKRDYNSRFRGANKKRRKTAVIRV